MRIKRTSPALRLAERLALFLFKSATVVLYDCAIPLRVSPFLTLWYVAVWLEAVDLEPALEEDFEVAGGAFLGLADSDGGGASPTDATCGPLASGKGL